MIRPSGRIAAVLAPLVAIALASIPNLPAAADVQKQAESLHPTGAQTLVVPAVVDAPDTTRDGYSVTVVSIVQWPSADHDVTGDGDFGARSCRGCSAYHEGDDFNPGGGTPVEVVADGVVTLSGWAGALGESVTVHHVINGVPTDTVYGHMQAGSLRVSAGQAIARGTVLGLVGSTGASTGNHLHFEVHLGGVQIDPMPWLLANVNDWKWN